MSDDFDFREFLAAGRGDFDNKVLPKNEVLPQSGQPNSFLCQPRDSKNPNITHVTEGYNPYISYHNFSDDENTLGE